MNMLKAMIAVLSVVTSYSAHTATFTIGDLTYDDTTKIISGNGYEYLGFDVLKGLTYAETVAITSAGGAYEDFHIAGTAEADFFIGSLFGSTDDNCSNNLNTLYSSANVICGTLAEDWVDGLFGENATSNEQSNSFGNDAADAFWFLADETDDYEVGALGILDSILDNTGYVVQNEWNRSIESADEFAIGGPYDDTPVSWMVVRDISAVPVPPSFTLMALGLAFLGGIHRRRKRTERNTVNSLVACRG